MVNQEFRRFSFIRLSDAIIVMAMRALHSGACKIIGAGQYASQAPANPRRGVLNPM